MRFNHVVFVSYFLFFFHRQCISGATKVVNGFDQLLLNACLEKQRFEKYSLWRTVVGTHHCIWCVFIYGYVLYALCVRKYK